MERVDVLVVKVRGILVIRGTGQRRTGHRARSVTVQGYVVSAEGLGNHK